LEPFKGGEMMICGNQKGPSPQTYGFIVMSVRMTDFEAEEQAILTRVRFKPDVQTVSSN
jgi:hypothetical protein